MARDRRRPTNRHVRRPGRSPLNRPPEPPRRPPPTIEALAETIDQGTVDAALHGEAENPVTWLALTMLLSAQTTTLLALVRAVGEDSEEACRIAWTHAGDAEPVLTDLRHAAVLLLALTASLEDVTEDVEPGGV